MGRLLPHREPNDDLELGDSSVEPFGPEHAFPTPATSSKTLWTEDSTGLARLTFHYFKITGLSKVADALHCALTRSSTMPVVGQPWGVNDASRTNIQRFWMSLLFTSH